MFDPSVYTSRRDMLCKRLKALGIPRGEIVFSAHGDSPVNYPDNAYPFRQDSNWLYYIGLGEPDMVAILDIESGSTILFGDEATVETAVWTGPRPSLRALAELSGIGITGSTADLGNRPRGSGGLPLYVVPTCRLATARRTARALGVEESILLGPADPRLVAAIVSQREVKEAAEIGEIEKAVGISVRMHRSLIDSLRPGWTEARAAAFVTSVALEEEAGLSFIPIATRKGAYLHNHSRDGVCAEGDLFLLDAGAESAGGYAGDLTSVFPVSARFSNRQAEIYELLEKVFAAATSTLAPKVLFRDVHLAAARALVEGLSAIGLMKGDPDSAVAAGAHALFFPHGLGHLIGLDVHDMEGLGEDAVGYGTMQRSAQFGLRSLRLAKALLPGMVHSVEPGIYFIPGLIDLWKTDNRHAEFIRYEALESWRDSGGMRLEEDWLVTETGARRLGPEFDRSRAALEDSRRNV